MLAASEPHKALPERKLAMKECRGRASEMETSAFENPLSVLIRLGMSKNLRSRRGSSWNVNAVYGLTKEILAVPTFEVRQDIGRLRF